MSNSNTPGPNETDKRAFVLLVKNLEAWEKGKKTYNKLDSNIKKNTSFIKKLKTFSSDNYLSIIKDIEILSLEKYLSEIIIGVCEGITKTKTNQATLAAVEIVSSLHQRFVENFTNDFIEHIRKLMKQICKQVMEEKEDDLAINSVSNLSKLRSILRVITELWLVGIFEGYEALSKKETNTICNLLKEILKTSKDGFMFISVVVSFVKNFGDRIYNPKGTEETKLMTEKQRAAFTNLLKEYYSYCSKKIVLECNKLRKMDKNNKELYISKGEINEAVKEKYEKLFKTYESNLTHVLNLSELLQLDPPDLPEEESSVKIGLVVDIDGVKKREDNFNSIIWEDAESKIFYEDLLDLKAVLPSSVFEKFLNKSKASKNNDQTLLKKEENKEAKTDTETVTTNANKSKESHSAPVNTQLDELIASLSNMYNKDQVDKAALAFCYINSKTNRAKITQELLQIPKTRLDLLPYYSRFVANLNQYIPEIGETMVKELEEEFKKYRNATKNHVLESRIKNIRYISELTKFGVTPDYAMFYCLKILSENLLHGANLDVVCALLENCGRYIYNKPEMCERTQEMVEVIMKKKSQFHPESRQALMLENAYYHCNPPSQPSIPIKVIPMMHQFIRKLVLVDLNKSNVAEILKLIRKLNWDDPEIYALLIRLFTKVWKIRHSNFGHLAALVSALKTYHSAFSVEVVDTLLENTQIGLEENDFKHNQRRLATMKFLGDLYNYRAIESETIFNTLYNVLYFGYKNGQFHSQEPNPFDLKNDFFRIRLVCVLLDTCGMCFNKGKERAELDKYIECLKDYINNKERLPNDIEFLINDSLEKLRPNMKGFTQSEKEATLSCTENEIVLNEESKDETTDDSDLESEEKIIRDLKVKEEYEQNFEKEFNIMMTENLEQNKLENTTNINRIVPSRSNDQIIDFSPKNESNVKFTLMYKKGNKSMKKTVNVPQESQLALSTMQQKKAELEEQRKMKELVLKYEKLQEHDEVVEFEKNLNERGIKFNFSSKQRSKSGNYNGDRK